MTLKIEELTYEYPTDRKPVVVGERKHIALIRGKAKRKAVRKKPGKR